jgi:hypothetical protein
MKPIAALAMLLLFFSAPVPARDVGGVNVPDSLTLQGEKNSLVLNGAGYRKKFFIKVYVGALYLAQPMTQAEAVLGASSARAMLMYFVHEVGTEKLASAWKEGVLANSTTAEARNFQSRIDQLNGMMRDMKPNDALRLEMPANGETRVFINDTLRGSVMGADFQRALLRVWLGPEPADASLKRAVLGEKD